MLPDPRRDRRPRRSSLQLALRARLRENPRDKPNQEVTTAPRGLSRPQPRRRAQPRYTTTSDLTSLPRSRRSLSPTLALAQGVAGVSVHETALLLLEQYRVTREGLVAPLLPNLRAAGSSLVRGSARLRGESSACDDRGLLQTCHWREKHVAGEGQTDTCVRARAGTRCMTELAWPPMSGWGSARCPERRRHRDSSAPIATTSMAREA